MKQLLILTILSLGMTMGLSAQQLVYQPKNPAFGGNPNNTAHLVNTATAQNTTVDPDATDRFGFSNRTDLESFTESLNSQILSQLSRSLVDLQFGEGEIEDGSYAAGNFQIDIANTLDGVVVTILDTNGGEQTQLIIPFF